jgi:hypothetical protein
MKPNKVKFVVRKYIFARSAQEAIRLDRSTPVSDVWVDEKWMELQGSLRDEVGFKTNEVKKGR